MSDFKTQHKLHNKLEIKANNSIFLPQTSSESLELGFFGKLWMLYITDYIWLPWLNILFGFDCWDGVVQGIELPRGETGQRALIKQAIEQLTSLTSHCTFLHLLIACHCIIKQTSSLLNTQQETLTQIL